MTPRDPAAILARDLADVSRHAPGKISVEVRDARGTVAAVDADREVPGVGVDAVLLLVALLDEVEAGRRSLVEVVELPAERTDMTGALALLPSVERLTVDELARLMVCQGDRTAAALLLDFVGAEPLRDVAVRVGMTATRVGGGIDSTTTAADLALLLAKLRAGHIVPFAHVRYAFELLGAQQHAVGLTALLPEGTLDGSMPGGLRGARYDTAVIETAEGRWASVAVLATGMEDTRYGQDYSVSVLPAFSAIGEAVLAYLTPVPDES